jgi:hypothetical protein
LSKQTPFFRILPVYRLPLPFHDKAEGAKLAAARAHETLFSDRLTKIAEKTVIIYG